MPSSPDHPIWETGPHLYLNEDKAPLFMPSSPDPQLGKHVHIYTVFQRGQGHRWDKWPHTLRDALLTGPPIGETGPYLHLDEDMTPGVWEKWPRTLRDALLPGSSIGETGPYI